MAGARWFKQDDGRLRYWDGARWTQHFCDPTSVPAGWYHRNDGLFVYWDGRRWSAVASKTGPRSQVSRKANGSAPPFRLPLAAVAASVLVAVLLVLYPRPVSGPSTAPQPTPPADTEASTPKDPASTPGQTPRTKPSPDSEAAAALAGLAVKGRAPKTGYDRDAFGYGTDLDGNGCDTREDILARDLTDRYVVAGNECETASGTLKDPYSSQVIDYRPGDGRVEIDHVVALGNAWVTGADRWPEDKRVRFANDPLNLLATDASLNAQKSDSDAASWVPKRSARCIYLARQIAVKVKYQLWVTPPERDALGAHLARCPEQGLPADVELEPTTPLGTDEPAPIDPPGPPTDPGQGGSEPYANCAEAEAAGAAPVYEGDPGYGPHLDRDHDGIGCDK